jgi:hypothetical protein
VRSAIANLAGCLRTVAATWLLLTVAPAFAGVLPEERSDLLYHRYDGGDVTVSGPSLLVRKNIGEQLSITGNVYADFVSSASIDVKFLSGASEYKEERVQGSLSAEYLRGKTTYSVSGITSDESDYTANTLSLGVSEDLFGDLTTISLGYTRAWDDVSQNVVVNGVSMNDPLFGERNADHRSYRLGVSQILTKSLLVALNYESQVHEGYLQNPYRRVRTRAIAGPQILIAPEVYPRTRTTSAVAIEGRYYLPWRASLRGSYRFFSDTWGVVAHTAEVGYVHPWSQAWSFEGSLRYHRQDAADFFGDLFPRPNTQNFMARDRNLATMNNQSVHLGATYQFNRMPFSWLEKASINLFADYIRFDFEDFRDIRASSSLFSSSPVAPGTEPFYTEDALVVRLFFSVYY